MFSVATNGSNFASVYSFTDQLDGGNPAGGLVLSGTMLYGTASTGGSIEGTQAGSVFGVSTNGSTFNVLFDFDETNGFNPYCTLALSGTTLYGTTTIGGANGTGEVFAINTAGTAFSTIHNFSATQSGTNSDGSFPYAGVVVSGTALYGTAVEGGTGGNGLVYAANTSGSGVAQLHVFGPGDGGENPKATVMILSGTTLYGTTFGVFSTDSGTVFSTGTAGSNFTTLHSFTTQNADGTNIDGANPDGGLALSGTTLYGTAVAGGTAGGGTLFKVYTNGTGFAVLHFFPSTDTDYGGPIGGIALSGTTIYGATGASGTANYGTVYSIGVSGSGFKTLHNFTNGSDGSSPTGLILSGTTLYGTTQGPEESGGPAFKMFTNGSGFTPLATVAYPAGNLLLSGTTLYGVDSFGGAGFGTIYSMGVSGTALTTLFDFTGGDNGDAPLGGLVLSGSTLYGSTTGGGANNNGLIFSFNLPQAAYQDIYDFSAFPFKAFNHDGAMPQAGLTLSGTTLYGVATEGGSFTYGTVFSFVP